MMSTFFARGVVVISLIAGSMSAWAHDVRQDRGSATVLTIGEFEASEQKFASRVGANVSITGEAAKAIIELLAEHVTPERFKGDHSLSPPVPDTYAYQGDSIYCLRNAEYEKSQDRFECQIGISKDGVHAVLFRIPKGSRN